MFKKRLIFGIIFTCFFLGLILLDAVLDGTISTDLVDIKAGTFTPKASILCVLLCLLAIPANLEMASLIGAVKVQPFTLINILGSIAMATSWYWKQFDGNQTNFHLTYLLAAIVILLFTLALYQGLRYAGKNMIANCSVNYFTIIYLGFFSSFFLGIRIDFGLWALLMFVAAVKFADIGAYTFGKNFGRTKFSPEISPNKTWEGVIGGIIFAAIVSVLIGAMFDIMDWRFALLFGAVFAFLGQLGDLIESMIKRDAEVKDSSAHVPGFGGLLDLLDSPLATAPLAYIYFMFTIQ